MRRTTSAVPSFTTNVVSSSDNEFQVLVKSMLFAVHILRGSLDSIDPNLDPATVIVL